MKVYSEEIKDGLEKIIGANQSIAYTSLLVPNRQCTIEIPNIDYYIAKANANPAQKDLFYLDSILASVGWNKNDDVFSAVETWKSKSTPVDKQFNYMHNESDIIGHITSSYVMVDNQQYEEEEIPEKFHIVVGSVLYKYWSDAELQKRMESIIAGIEDGDWYVSMECLFNDFDYELIDPFGKHKTVARNEGSAFLTKHLRVYGGTGEYEGHKVGRLLRNFIFSGKGLVKKPANPDSIIFVPNKSNSDFSSANFLGSNLMFDGCSDSINLPFQIGDSMSNGVVEMSDAYKAQADELKRELENERGRAKRMEAQIKEAADNEYKERLTNLQEEVNVAVAELESARTQIKELTDKSLATEKANESLTKKLDDTAKELSNTKAEVVKVSRLSLLAKAGITGKQAEGITKKFASSPDEVFNEFVQLYASQNKTQAQETVTAIATEEFEEEQDDSDDVEDFDFVSAKKSPSLATAGVRGNDANSNKVQKSTAEWLRNSFTLTRAKK